MVRSEEHILTDAGLCIDTRGQSRKLVAFKASIPVLVGQSTMYAAGTRHALTDANDSRPQRRVIRPLRDGASGVLHAIWQAAEATA